MTRVIQIDNLVTIASLAEKLEIPATTIIGELFKNGMMVTINEKIDIDTATIIVEELELDVKLESGISEEEASAKIASKPARVHDNLEARPPVVAVMGHVDHGKTSLLDKIRESDVVSHEAGGITQHISAYQIEHNGRKVTFLDTPGHEAFAALREHGAMLTDVAIIVVAADDGIKPQTLEAIRFAQKAGVKMIIAASKIDKETADINRLKQQLAEQNMIPEDWGGDTIVMPVSSKTGEGMNELLDMVFLVADIEELTAEFGGPAEGLAIESQMQQGKGPVARFLVQHGLLKKGDFVVAGSSFGKIKDITDSKGKLIDSAGPSTPVIVSGLKQLVDFGESFVVVKNEREAKEMADNNAKGINGQSNSMTGTELLRIISKRSTTQELKIIIKADVQGSLTSVIDGIKTMDTNEVATRIVGSSVGMVTENDIRTAAASDAVIYGFNIELNQTAKSLAKRYKVEVVSYRVIYELLDDIKARLQTMLAPEIVETILGRLKLKAVFKTTKSEIICGGEVLSGPLSYPAFARIFRDKKQIADAELINLKRGPQDVKEVQEGEMCGLSLKTDDKVALVENDEVEFFTRQTKQRTL